jgi:hypothetical protein
VNPDDCRNRVRFALSDSTGVLRFTDFDIVDAPECREVAKTLKAYLVGRPLAELDLDHIRGLSCGGNGQCVRDVADEIEDYRRILAPNDAEMHVRDVPR